MGTLTPKERAQIKQKIVAITNRLAIPTTSPEDCKRLKVERDALEQQLASDSEPETPTSRL